ncbi:hypothetical protein Tco_1259091 [Tanacetum coccineum]
MFDEYFETPSVERLVPPAHAVPDLVVSTNTPSSTIIDLDAPSTSHSSSSLKVDNNPFHNTFAPKPSSEESSSRDVSSANSNQVIQPHDHLRKWSKDHPMDNIIGNPSRLVSTCKQLAIDALWCLYNFILLKVEPKNFQNL